MLAPIQRSGSKPPLFLVHGMHGHITAASTFARVLGPDLPLYAVLANGIDGRQPVIDDLGEMVRAYVEEIRTARPTGPLHIGGICEGGLVAIEIARELQQVGQQVGPVILVDPPAVPPGYNRQNHTVNPREPRVAERLYQSVRHNLLDHASHSFNDSAFDAPFDPGDPKQLHAATLAGVGSLTAFCRHVPKPFSGSAALIVSAARAARFFDPQLPGYRLFRGPRLVFVLPWQHKEFFIAGREHIARFIKYLLEESPAWEKLAERQVQGSIA
jgi:thioesterase domain-containing protein